MADDLRARLQAALEPFTHNGVTVDAELGDVLAAVEAVVAPPTPEADLGEEMRQRKLGAYRLYWKSGGSSVAAVGMAYDGTRWFAPANWTTGSVNASLAALVSTDWSGVERVELIEPYRNTTGRRGVRM